MGAGPGRQHRYGVQVARIVPLTEVTTPPTKPLESAAVVDYVLLSMPSLLKELL